MDTLFLSLIHICFEKCWRLIGGEWWMYKRADRLALFSELFVYELGTALGFPMAYYERVDGSTIRSVSYTHLDVYKRQGQYPAAARRPVFRQK